MNAYSTALLKIKEERAGAASANNAAEDELKKTNPEYAALNEQIAKLGVSLVKATISKAPTEEIKKQLHEANEKKLSLMPEKKYYCEICKDKGDTSCMCFKKIYTEILMQNQTDLNTGISFDDFKTDCYSDDINSEKYGISESPKSYMTKVLNHCKKYAERIPDREQANMIFTGKTGLGKTFMCTCITNEVLSRGMSAIYIKASELFDEITFKGNDELRKEVENTKLLIIDDIGAERQTDMRYSDFLDILDRRNILHEKYGYGTVFSTNLDPKALLSYYGERICSRLFGQYEIIRFAGDDIRLK